MAVRTWKARRESSHGSLQSTWEEDREREIVKEPTKLLALILTP